MDDLMRKFCSLMGIFALLQTFVPPSLRKWLDRSFETLWEKLFQTADSYVYMEVEEKPTGRCYNAFYNELAADIEHRNAQRHLYTNDDGEWEGTPFNHPSTFDTLALEANLVERIKADLDTFSKGEKFYHKNGRAWKRGYLLYGPPGTGKSSMIAAIANYLQFDVYDLELTKVFDNSELKSLLTQTTRKSIIVIEDIDCTVQFPDRTVAEESSSPTKPASDKPNESPDGSSKLTLSGLLNFTDGLWSCCGEERIFIFTTNHRDKLDPALLRPGRMDMHILLSYCSFAAVKKMAFNYLGIQDHHMLPALGKTMEGGAHQVTPAAVAELLISNEKDPDAALKQVMAAFQGSSAAQEGVEDSSHLVLQEASPKKGRSSRTFFIFSVKSKRTD